MRAIRAKVPRQMYEMAEFPPCKSSKCETLIISNLMRKGYEFVKKVRNQPSRSRATITPTKRAAGVVTSKTRYAEEVGYLP